MKKKLLILAIPLLLSSLASCNQNPNGPTNPEDIVIDEHYYDNVAQRVKFDDSNENNFTDEITNGLDDSVWYTLDGFWEAGGDPDFHNGVRRRNIFYSKDDKGNGYLVMKARGKYNEDRSLNGKAEGACIETKNKLGPGRYEVEMAAMPRDGGCSAFWTFGCPSGDMKRTQNEIDIEIGGNGQFTNMWCTTWTTQTNKDTKSPDVTNICYMNDGKIHKYTFDWYTDFMGSGKPRIDWFIDGQHVQSITNGAIPDTEMPLWLGVWMPSWTGKAKFEDEYMIVDKVSFKAFDYSQYYDSDRSYTTYSPKAPSESNIQNIDFASVTTNHNMLSNADFETIEEYATDDHYGWFKHESSTGTLELSDEHTIGNHSFKLTAPTNEVCAYTQELLCMYEGFEFDISFDAKLADENSSARLWIRGSDLTSSTGIYSESIRLDSTTFKTYTKNFTLPKGVVNLRINLLVEAGSAFFDNAKLLRK